MDGAIEEGPPCGSTSASPLSKAVMRMQGDCNHVAVKAPLPLHGSNLIVVVVQVLRQCRMDTRARCALQQIDYSVRLAPTACKQTLPALRTTCAQARSSARWPACLQFYLEMDRVSEDFLWGRLQPLLHYLSPHQREKVLLLAPPFATLGHMHLRVVIAACELSQGPSA